MASFRIGGQVGLADATTGPGQSLSYSQPCRGGFGGRRIFRLGGLGVAAGHQCAKKRREAALARLAAASPSPQRLLGQVEALIPDLTPKPSAPLSPLIAPGSSIEGVGLSFCFE